MSDIVERLKDHESEGVTQSDRFHLREDAADEIERLRAELDCYKANEAAAIENMDNALLMRQDAIAERDKLRELLREANTHMRYHNIAEGLRGMIDAALGGEKS